jgi:hypothetical protein
MESGLTRVLPYRAKYFVARSDSIFGEVLSKFGQLLVPMFSDIPMVLQPGLPTAILPHVPVGRSSYAASEFRLSLLVLNSSQVYGHS